MSSSRQTRSAIAGPLRPCFLAAAAFLWGAPATGADQGMPAVPGAGLARVSPSGPDPHAHHAIHTDGGHVRSLTSYQIPPVTLVDAEGTEVSLASLLSGTKPLMLNFIFTTCTAICPVQTATFARVQTALGDRKEELRMVSVSIDPEQDTPARLRDYAAEFDAGAQWLFLTGSLTDIVAVQKAFDAYPGDKASHVPLTFLHASPDGPWVRIEGFISAAELVQEFRTLLARR